MARLYGNETLFDKDETGITDMYLVLTTKDSDQVAGELNAKGGFSDHYQKYSYNTLATNTLG